MHNRSGRLPLLLTWAFAKTLDFQSFNHSCLCVHSLLCLPSPLPPPPPPLCIWQGSMSCHSVTCHKFGGSCYRQPSYDVREQQGPASNFAVDYHASDFEKFRPDSLLGGVCVFVPWCALLVSLLSRCYSPFLLSFFR